MLGSKVDIYYTMFISTHTTIPITIFSSTYKGEETFFLSCLLDSDTSISTYVHFGLL